jgi:hypothetical protein
MTKQKKFISVNRFSVQIDIIEHFYEGKKIFNNAVHPLRHRN